MIHVCVALTVVAWLTTPLSGADVGTTFTYQGRLTDNGEAANGLYDFQFSLATGDWPLGFLTGTPIIVPDLEVVDGLFTVKLDFGDSISGYARWLDVAVRPGASAGSYTSLLPRQELTPAPYAIGLALPYVGVNQNASTLVTLDQQGTGNAMALMSGAGHGLDVSTDAGGNAVYAHTTGSGAGVVATTSGAGAALYGQTSGGAHAIHGYNLGSSGRAGYFRNESTLNTSDCLRVETNGSGAAIRGIGGTGRAGWFQITNASSAANALEVTTVGAGGSAARFETTNANNTSNTISGRNTGLGRAALLEITNPASTSNALEVITAGSGLAGKFVGDVEVVGHIEAQGQLLAHCGNVLNRGTPIAFGTIAYPTNALTNDSGNVVLFKWGDPGNGDAHYDVTVLDETNAQYWVVVADIVYNNPATTPYTFDARAGKPDANGKFKIYVKCTGGCDQFMSDQIDVSFVVYKAQ
ncbi:MAG: hypothetical protein DCC65_11010 [Planctomycetota bacterium]|nr:MAG: hypothetical protein DCC65_11010 [Planctomycetota bacterium]